MVPDSGKERDFIDCVVPESKSNADHTIEAASNSAATGLLDSVSSVFAGPDINEHTPLLYYAESSYLSTFSTNLASTSSQNALLPTFNLQTVHTLAMPSDSCFNHTLFQLHEPSSAESSLGSNTQGSYCGTDNSSIHSRLVQSSEQLHVLSHTTNTSGVSQRRRRNSSGSESRMRRHSAAPFRTVSLTPHIQRQRRRSHDVGDEQVDLLERLRIAATRRRSFSAPFQSNPTLLLREVKRSREGPLDSP